MTRAPTAKSSSPSDALWRTYQRDLAALSQQISGGFATNLKQAIGQTAQIAARGYHVWRLAHHRDIRKRALEPIRRRFNGSCESKHFVAILMDGLKDIDGRYASAWRYMLESAFERMDELSRNGEWDLPSDAPLKQIEDKLTELGGTDPSKVLPTIHTAWVKQRREYTYKAVRERQEIERVQRGFGSVEEMIQFDAKRQETAHTDMLKAAWRQFLNQSRELLEPLDVSWQDGEALILATKDHLYRFSEDERDAAVAFLSQRRRTKAAEAAKQNRASKKGSAQPSGRL